MSQACIKALARSKLKPSQDRSTSTEDSICPRDYKVQRISQRITKSYKMEEKISHCEKCQEKTPRPST